MYSPVKFIYSSNSKGRRCRILKVDIITYSIHILLLLLAILCCRSDGRHFRSFKSPYEADSLSFLTIFDFFITILEACLLSFFQFFGFCWWSRGQADRGRVTRPTLEKVYRKILKNAQAINHVLQDFFLRTT